MSYSEESIKLWSERDVGLWLQEAGLRDCVDEFRSLQITGVRLLLLGPDDLKSFLSLKGSDKKRKAVKKALSALPGNSMTTTGKKKFGKFGKKDPPMVRRPIHQQNEAQPPLPPPPGAPPLPSRPGPPSHAPPLPPRGFEEQDVYEEFDEALHGGGLPEEAFDAEDSFDEEDESAPMGQRQEYPEIAAKFRAFGIGGHSRVQEEDDDFGDNGEDIYDMPPDEDLPTAQRGEDSDDEPSDIYDLPPDSEIMQGHVTQFQPPPPPPPPENVPTPYIEARGHSIAQSPEDIYEMEDSGEPEGIYEMQDDDAEDIYDIADEDEPPAPARPPKPDVGGPMSRPAMRPPLKSPRSESPERGGHESQPAVDNSKMVMPEYLRERFERAKNRPNTSGLPSTQVSNSSMGVVEPEHPSPPQGRAPMPLPPREPQPPSPPVERGPPRLPPKEFSAPADRPPARPPKEILVSPPTIPSKESPLLPRKMEEFTDHPPQLPPKETGLGFGAPVLPPKPGSPMADRHALKGLPPAPPSKSPVSSPALQRPPKPPGLSKEEPARPSRAQKLPPSPQMSHRPFQPTPEELSPEEVSCPPPRERSISPDASDPKLKRRSSGKIADLMARFEQKTDDSHPPTKPKPSLAKRWPPVQPEKEELHRPPLPSKPAPPSKPAQPLKPQLPEKDKPPPPSKPSRPFPPPSEAHARLSPPSSPVSRRPPIPPKSEPAPPHVPHKEPHNASVMNSHVHTVRVGGGGGIGSRPALPPPREYIRSPSPSQAPPILPEKPPPLGGEVPPRLPDRPQLFPSEESLPPPIPQEPPPMNVFREMKPKSSGFPPPITRPPAPPPDDKPLPPLPPAPSIPSPLHNDTGIGRAPPPVPMESVYDQPWYHGNIDRHEVQRRLGMFPKVFEDSVQAVWPPVRLSVDGCFLVRAAQKGEGFSLSLWYGGQPRHLRIRQRDDNQYAVGEKKESEVAFPDILDLVAHHQKEPLVLKSGGQTLLTHVCPQN